MKKDKPKNIENVISTLPHNIIRNLQLARLSLLLSFGSIVIIAIYAIYAIISNKKESELRTVLIDTKGIVYKGLTFLSDKEALRIHAIAQIELFVKLFYQFSRENINYNLQHAQYLGDNTIRDIFLKNEANHFYSRIIDVNAASYVDPITLKKNITISTNITDFTATFPVYLITPQKRGVGFQVTIKGKLIPVSPSENNAHGIRITNLSQTINPLENEK